jgi:hypothetical protein
MFFSITKQSEIPLKHLELLLDAAYAIESSMFQRLSLQADHYRQVLPGLAQTATQ